MKRIFLLALLATALWALSTSVLAQSQDGLRQYVEPRIGTAHCRYFHFAPGALPFGNIQVSFFRDGFRMVVFSVVIMIIVLFFSKGIMGNKELSFAGLIKKIKAKKAAKAEKVKEGGAA